MNTRNTLKMRLLAMTVLFVAVLMPLSVSAQKPQKEPKKQTEQTVKEQKEPKESGKQKEVKEPKEPKAESGKQKEVKEPKEPKEPKADGKKQKERTEESEQTTEQSEQKSESKKQKGQKPVDATHIALEEVPVAVIKAYKKRYASAADPVWQFYKEEQIYKVNCVYRGVPSLISFTDEGIWVETTEEHPTEKLSSACIKTINMYYRDYKINSLKKVLTSSKNDMFIVGLFESQNIKKRIETIVYLETSGAYIRADDPALNEDIPVQIIDQVDKKRSREDKRLEKEFGKNSQMDDTPVKLLSNELPPAIQRWVSRNYPEYVYKDVAYGEYDDFEAEGNIYQIVIQKNGINQPHATVWFTRNGDFLKLEDNFKEDIQIIDPSTEVKTAKETEKKSAKETEKKSAKEVITTTDEDRSISVEEEEVKAEIVTAFKTKYPRAKNVSWAENERDGEWIISFTDQYGQNTATFSDISNEWMYTKTHLPEVNKIPAVIRNYIVKNHPKKQVTQGWVIKSPDAKPYYTVELYTKKGKEYEQIDFLQNGKLKE